MTSRAPIAFAVLIGCGAAGRPSTTNTGQTVVLEWRAVQAAADHVDVSIVVNGSAIALGKLEAFTDDAAGTPATCAVHDHATATAVEFGCGGTPMFNYYRAELQAGTLVITRVTGANNGKDHEHEDEKHTEVTRAPVSGTTLSVVPFTPTPPSP